MTSTVFCIHAMFLRLDLKLDFGRPTAPPQGTSWIVHRLLIRSIGLAFKTGEMKSDEDPLGTNWLDWVSGCLTINSTLKTRQRSMQSFCQASPGVRSWSPSGMQESSRCRPGQGYKSQVTNLQVTDRFEHITGTHQYCAVLPYDRENMAELQTYTHLDSHIFRTSAEPPVLHPKWLKLTVFKIKRSGSGGGLA